MISDETRRKWNELAGNYLSHKERDVRDMALVVKALMKEKGDRVGICIIFDLMSMQLFVYTLDTYELANKQAEELLKGCNPELLNDMGETTDTNNKTRQRTILFGMEMILVRETEVGKEVLPIK